MTQLTPRTHWVRAKTDRPGTTGYTITIGETPVVVVFTGDSHAPWTGDWEAYTGDGILLRGGGIAALSKNPSSRTVVESLDYIGRLLASDQQEQATPAPARPAVEYKVVPLIRHADPTVYANATQAVLTDHAAQGWRLVTVQDVLAYFERPVA